MSGWYKNVVVSDKQAIVDDKNERSIRGMLAAAIRAEPDKDRDVILDREARKLISEKLK